MTSWKVVDRPKAEQVWRFPLPHHPEQFWTISNDVEVEEDEDIEPTEPEILKTYDDKPIIKREETISALTQSLADINEYLEQYYADLEQYYAELNYDLQYNYHFQQNTNTVGLSIVRIIPICDTNYNYLFYVVVTKNDGIYLNTDSDTVITSETTFCHVACTDMGLNAEDEVLDAEAAIYQEQIVLYICVKYKGIYVTFDFNTWYATDVCQNSPFSAYVLRQTADYQIICRGNRDDEPYTGDFMGGVYIAAVSELEDYGTTWWRNNSLPREICATCVWHDPYIGCYFVGFAANETGEGGVYYTTEPQGEWYQVEGDLCYVEITSIVSYYGVVKVGGDGIWETYDITQGLTKNTTVPDDTGYYLEYDFTRAIWWAIPKETDHSVYLTTDNGTTWNEEKWLPKSGYSNICVYNSGVMLATAESGIYSTTEVKSESNTANRETSNTAPIVQISEALSNIETKIQTLESSLNLEPIETEYTTATHSPVLIRDEKIQNLLTRVRRIQDSLPS